MRPLAFLLGVVLVSFIALPLEGRSWRDDPVIKTWWEELESEQEHRPGALAPRVTIRNGTVQGITTLSIGSHVIYQFLGLPFAKPPVGDLRFEAPQTYNGWGSRVFKANRYPKSCAQLLSLTPASEDCLYLSIHSRRKGSNGDGPLLPVVVFIHGGGFVLGQNAYYGGYKLLENEVILVTVQYRLGPLGFFYTGDDTVSGNNGMKDMVMALRWVQENIEAFGGNPNQVTVMGESAGSASALYMLISPLAHGLYHRVIGMSGSPLQEWAIDRDPVRSAKKLGEAVKCPTDNNTAMVKCLRTKHWFPIVTAGMENIRENFENFKMFLSGSMPVIEGYVPGAFLPDDPLKLMTEGPLPDVQVLLGATQHEGLLPQGAVHYLNLQQNNGEKLKNRTYMREQLMGDLLSTYGIDEGKDGASISQSLAAGYLKPGVDRSCYTEIHYELLDLISAVFMKAPILRTAEILSRRLSSVYLYSFEYYNQYGASLYNLAFNVIVPIMGGSKPPTKAGICHADDLIYMFRLPIVPGPRDLAFSKTFCELFANFMIHGTPTPHASAKYPAWPKYDVDTQRYMKLAKDFEVKSDYMASWKQGTPGAK